MCFTNMNEKNMIIDKYNSYSRVAIRDINKMGIEKYMIVSDISKIIDFIKILKTVRFY